MYNQNERSSEEHIRRDDAIRVCRDESCGTGSAYHYAAGSGGTIHSPADSCRVPRIKADSVPHAGSNLPHSSAAQRGRRVAIDGCMPTRVGRPCRAPGCPAIVKDGSWCPAHRPAEAPRPSPSARGYDKRWQAIRLAYLARFPLCAHCEREGRVTPATEVDHIRPLALGGTHDAHNLQPLCKSCHSKKTRKAQGEGGTKSLRVGAGVPPRGSRARGRENE